MAAMISMRSCDADRHQRTLNRPYREQCVGSLARVDFFRPALAPSELLPAPSKAEGHMSKNHRQDSFDGGRAASLSTNPPAPTMADLLARKRIKPEDDDALALALAMLALTEGGDLGGN
jgi:hypothetical protein